MWRVGLHLKLWLLAVVFNGLPWLRFSSLKSNVARKARVSSYALFFVAQFFFMLLWTYWCSWQLCQLNLIFSNILTQESFFWASQRAVTMLYSVVAQTELFYDHHWQCFFLLSTFVVWNWLLVNNFWRTLIRQTSGLFSQLFVWMWGTYLAKKKCVSLQKHWLETLQFLCKHC